MSQNNFETPFCQTPDDLSQAFCSAFRHHPAGVAILTAAGSNGPVALTVSSLISVNAAPPLIAFSLSSASSTATEFLKAQSIVVHFPGRADKSLALLCASRGADRFDADIPWQYLPTGEPLYTNIKTWFRARLTHQIPLAGATLVAAEILDGHSATNRTSENTLVYLNRQWHSLQPEDELLECMTSAEAHASGAWRFWY